MDQILISTGHRSQKKDLCALGQSMLTASIRMRDLFELE
jgi:hypothetical protein